MELSDNELRNIVAGTDQEVAEKQAIDNKELYRESSIEELQKIKEQLNNLKNSELSKEELEEVKAGNGIQR